MKRNSRWILAGLTVSLLLILVFASSSGAQVAAISKAPRLLAKSILPLPPVALRSALAGSSVKHAAGNSARSGGVIAGTSYHSDTSPALRDIPPVLENPKDKGEHEANPNPKIPSNHKDSPDEVVQSRHFASTPSIPGTILNFDGIPFPGVACDCAPPDTDGEVGATQYVQMVNEGFQIFDKTTGASVFGPVGISTLWAGFGGVCETAGDGDPVVLYDQLANRWLISQFAGASVPTDECIAISKTSDATGPYFRYGFHLGTNFFDYPKIAVWPDAYYMSMNIFNTAGTAFLGPQPFAFDRAAMLAGDPTATFVSTGITGGPAEDSYHPADLDGSALPLAGAPGTFVEWPGSGVYKVFHFHADFAVPANTTFTLFASPAAAGFTELCPTTRACVPQLGSATNLDGIGDRFMHRLAYRNFGGFESVVGNFSVLSTGVSAIRWFELRNVTAGPVTVFQESTYQPDTTWRWMGSAAMDNQGNLAIGFSASSSAIFPQIRYAGRLAGDPLNTLAQGEAHLFDGTGSQAGTSSRWGDYSALSIDPGDDCTFWYTQEYYSVPNSSFNWRTRVGNFKFAECTAPATGTAHFAVTICDGGAPLPGALVSIDGSPAGATLADGTYDATLVPGSHTYSVSKASYATASGSFSISAATTTPVSVCLQGTPVVVAAGSTLVDEACAPPNGVIDPHENVTLAFNLMNTGGASTTDLVATLLASGGVTPITTSQDYGVIAPGGSAAKNFQFTAGGVCGGTITATLHLQDGALDLGDVSYTFTLGTVSVAFSENFDSVVAPALPAGWAATNAVNPDGIFWVTSSSGTPAPPADTAPNAAFVNDPAAISDKRLDSPSIAISSPSAQLTFRNNWALESGFDGGVLEIAIGAGPFTDIVTAGGSFVTGGYTSTISSSFSNPLAGRRAWSGSSGGFVTTTVNLPAAAAGNNIVLRWRMASDTSVSNPGWRVDTIRITDGFICCGPQLAAAGTTITHENCFPPNGVIDPGETVQVSFCVKNNGTGSTTDMVGTLQASGGVTSPSAPADYGVIAPGATVCRVFTFTADGSCGGNITASLQLQDGATDLGTVTYTFTLGVPTVVVPLNENFDGVVAPALPAAWTTTASGTLPTLWVTSATNPSSAPNDAFAPDLTNIADDQLITPAFVVPSGGAQLTFKNLYNMESSFDGMVLEISINGGAFQDITTGGNAFLAGGYNATISSSFGNPIGGRAAWSGLSGGTTTAPTYITSTINLPASANGQSVQLKWRAASDNSVAASGSPGVRIDNVVVSGIVYVCCELPDLTTLSPAKLWVGLKNSDDQGTQFDIKVEVLKNGTAVASGLQRCMTGLTRNPNLAKETNVAWDPFASLTYGSGDVLGFRVSTRVGTNPDGTKCAGPGGSHNNAVGLRLYYDSASQASHFDATITPNPNENLYLHSNGNPCGNAESTGVTTRSLSDVAPAGGSSKCKDSGSINFAKGNPFSEIGTWNLPAFP